MSEYFLEMNDISKSFPGVHALDHVTLKIKKGEVHALVGENGAGKSTLMKVLAGVHRPDSGEIKIDGKAVCLMNPQDAISSGISIIYQELSLVPHLNAIQNVMLGHEIHKFKFINKKEEYAEATKWLDYASRGILQNYNAPVRNYSVAMQQMVDIAKALSYNAQIIVMDEPTDSLTDCEITILFEIIAKLKADGITVIYISHRLEEIFQVCDSVTVLRDGKYIAGEDTKNIDKNWLIKQMIGRDLGSTFPPRNRSFTDETVLKVEHLCSDRFTDINFEVKRGEILGFAGLVGSGRTEVMRAIFGADPVHSGTVVQKGKKKGRHRHPSSAVDARIGFATEDRKSQGLFLNLDIKTNVCAAVWPKIMRSGFIPPAEETGLTKKYIADLKIAATGPAQRCKNLSGGNQQKVVLAKWLATQSEILILDEPTRGIDVGAKYEIYTLMDRLAQEGVSIIMISSEMPEVIAMSDRVVVMHEGRIMGELGHEELEEEKIMTLATGGC